MQTKGKFYIWLNVASETFSFWNQAKEAWTSDPYGTTFFDTRAEADREAKIANEQCDAHGVGEAVVAQCQSDLQPLLEKAHDNLRRVNQRIAEELRYADAIVGSIGSAA